VYYIGVKIVKGAVLGEMWGIHWGLCCVVIFRRKG